MLISLIAAVSENGFIGLAGSLPWQLPADLRYFKQTTAGHHIIMGRKTYESIGRPLPGRTNIVVSRREGYLAPGCLVVSSLEKAAILADAAGEGEAFVIGGADLYRAALEVADKIYLTKVHATVEGDVMFPLFDEGDFAKSTVGEHAADDLNPFAMTFVTYVRIRLA